MKQVIHFPHLTCIVFLFCTLSVLPASAMKIKATTTGSYCADFSTIAPPDSLTALSIFADRKALIKVYCNATGVMIQLVSADELTQRQWLFNGLTVFVDPMGKGKKRYSLVFPSVRTMRHAAMSLSDQNGNDSGQTQPANIDSSQANNQPPQGITNQELRKLIQQFDENGATLNIDAVSSFAGTSLAKVTVAANHQLCYNVILPYALFNIPNLSPQFISVGVLSEFVLPQRNGGTNNDTGESEGGHRGGGMRGGGMGGMRGGMSRYNGGMTGFGDLQKTIEGWIQVTVENK
jgi:hypothetical protein